MELITITAATIMSLFMNISGTANSNSHFHGNAEMQDGKVSAINTTTTANILQPRHANNIPTTTSTAL